MTNNKFDFKEMLQWSNEQEQQFMKTYKKHKLIPSTDRKWDFTTPRGLKVELKSDTYDADKTGNFFLERYSDMYKKTPGGIWRSAQDGVDIFIYHFVSNNVYYEFRDLPDLVKVLDKLTEKMYVVGVRNKAWITGGYKIPRDLLCNYFTRVKYK